MFDPALDAIGIHLITRFNFYDQLKLSLQAIKVWFKPAWIISRFQSDAPLGHTWVYPFYRRAAIEKVDATTDDASAFLVVTDLSQFDSGKG